MTASSAMTDLPLEVHLIGVKGGRNRAAFIALPGAVLIVRVRYAASGGICWRCDACGRFPTPECGHAAAMLAELEKEKSHDDNRQRPRQIR